MTLESSDFQKRDKLRGKNNIFEFEIPYNKDIFCNINEEMTIKWLFTSFIFIQISYYY